MLVIIHGWSDNARSFNALGNRLVSEGVTDGVVHVRLGDYVSLDDNVTFEDLTEALQAAWKKENLPTSARSVDVVVHSTGGLVIRHWMTTYYKPGTSPVYRLLMLAPANFGSPLAHKGRSFVGRVFKGFKSERMFETGEKILKGLELSSPFSRALAMKDLFSGDVGDAWYGPGKILCTVMVGSSGYSGISAAANEDGSDGTVRVSTANLQALHVRLDFSSDPQKPTIELAESAGMTAFARVADENHSTIALKDGGPKNSETVPMMVDALKVTDSTFEEWVHRLAAYSDIGRMEAADNSFSCGYQNTVVHLCDSQGEDVRDYFLELFVKDKDDKVSAPLTEVVQHEVISTVHSYGDNMAHRSLLLNIVKLNSEIIDKGNAVNISLTAMPEIKKTNTVGYSTFGYDDIGSIRVRPQECRRLFLPDRTVLIDIVIKREQRERVFQFLRLG